MCHQDHRYGDVHRYVGDGFAGGVEEFDEAGVFLSAATAEANQLHFPALDPFRRPGEGFIVDSEAVGIGAGRGLSFVQGEPFLGLFDAVVVELMIDAAVADGIDKVLSNAVRKLAGMDIDGHDGPHEGIVRSGLREASTFY